MQVLQAGQHKLILLEFDNDILANIAKQAGFECKLEEGKRSVALELSTAARQTPLLLFDAADPSNLGWFSRCQFYVDGTTGAVLQTPITVANRKDTNGRIMPNGLRLQLAKELPLAFRLPGRSPVTEQTVYAVFYNLLTALTNTGVGVCGGGIVRPLAGRTENPGVRN